MANYKLYQGSLMRLSWFSPGYVCIEFITFNLPVLDIILIVYLQFPLLRPGEEEFVYESRASLPADQGSVEGSFTFVPGRYVIYVFSKILYTELVLHSTEIVSVIIRCTSSLWRFGSYYIRTKLVFLISYLRFIDHCISFSESPNCPQTAEDRIYDMS